MEIEMTDEVKELVREQKRYYAEIKGAKRGFGDWDICDPVVWAILEVVKAQTAFARAMEENVCYGVGNDVVEAAIEERRKAIVALTEALASEPRGYQ